MRTAVRFALGLTFAVVASGAACPNQTPETPPAPGSWLVLLCRTNDASFDPQPRAFYEAAFSKDSTDLLWQYFDAMSDHAIDISGSRARGWFTMTVSSADIAVRNVNTNPGRNQTAQDCRSAAAVGLTNMGVSVDFEKYFGVISVINQPADVGRAGGKNIVATSQFESDLTFVEHEMLHVYGLRHSNRMSPDATADHIFAGTVDSVYWDCWDIMSSATCVDQFFTANHGGQGPGIQAAYLEKLGWIPANRVFAPGTSIMASIMLAPVSERAKAGNLLARVEVPSGSYVVEYRVPTGFDRAIPQRSVVIREERGANKVTYLVTRSNGSREWLQGEVFTDTRNWLRIGVTDVTADYATISINTASAPGVTPAGLGQKCGDKFTGQTLPCSANLRCTQRRTGILVGTEYYCDP